MAWESFTDIRAARGTAAAALSDVYPARPFPSPAEGGGPPGPPPPGPALPAPTPGATGTSGHPTGSRGRPTGTRDRAAGTDGPSAPAEVVREAARVPGPDSRADRTRGRAPNGALVASSVNGRDPFLDNAKFLLVVLVVLGHNWSPVADGMREVKAAWLLVYAFHVPALVLLCGYFSRGFTGRPEQIRRLLVRLLVPYLLFETAYSGVYTLCWNRPFIVTPTEPSYLCWFLVALFVWRLTALLWRAVRWPVAFAALVSVLAGFTELGPELALPQTLMYLPWFVLGLRLRPEHLRPLRNPAARRWALPVMVAGAAGAWWAAPRVGRGWLLMELSYERLGVPVLQYVGVRVALFGIGAVLVAAFLALAPSRRTGFTALGACSLYPFLLHGLVIKAVEGFGWYQAVVAGGLLAVAGTTVVAGLLAALLSAPQLRRVLRPLTEPPFPGWLCPGRGAEGGSLTCTGTAR
ncbi:hypothetical protein OIE63_24585 [Streptomyces sp. NBC_01795]|uniref:acyltransferase family protein n=1 Tax=unclassified Streptomyces TaxID=2593676 RepID=UPI002DDB803F|nr:MULTISPECIES: acyltransferase family protein [unclassified Streptomyces]WSA94396.1 hypothetical protein OIE63_24585 [Streptomyces sp. NBC_01795]WSB78814.1 hypothetical protein OHB04_25700 [Streptomyces sp. NBC_01775]WSS12983.1 hypothetical protein OG533_14530 [Streptomyces sp. NBC_01186]